LNPNAPDYIPEENRMPISDEEIKKYIDSFDEYLEYCL
jgi:hypothetical protein